MAAASSARGHGDQTDLTGAIHHVLATLTDVRRDTPIAELRGRIALARWLRIELAAVESLLTDAFGRRAAVEASPELSHTG